MRTVECRNLQHSYDGVRYAVHDVSFTIRRGEVLALIGPNGAGKSTTLRILATLQQPDSGAVYWDDADAWSDRYRIRQRIGFLGDASALYPGMTAAGYLRFFAECHGQDDRVAKQKVDELLDRFDLAGKADVRVGDLSKGTSQRLAIARTLIHDPELLLLDEPGDGLDPLGRKHLRTVLREVAHEGVAIVVSSHLLRELDDFCDAIALIQNGKLEVFGTVEHIVESYEVKRRLHEVHVTKGLQTALQVLKNHEGLVETVDPLDKHDSAQTIEDMDRGIVAVRIHGDKGRPAHILRELVLAGVDVIAFAKVRSDLEDVYQSLGRDKIS